MPNQHIILFYKYMPLSKNKTIMQMFQNSLIDLCTSLHLKGRILVGLSDDSEGLNGTLAGDDKLNLLAFTYALLGKSWCEENETKGIVIHSSSTSSKQQQQQEDDDDQNIILSEVKTRSDILYKFWEEIQSFANIANIPCPRLNTPEDFKWSTRDIPTDEKFKDLFPDLNIKLVNEIINTGGVLSNVPINETSKDYLTPEEWHQEIDRMVNTKNEDDNNDTILIDCRNHKEFAIGHFTNAIDPNTKSFAQFPKWVQDNKSSLKDKKILMYCTGGIRCEKASAFVRRELEPISDNEVSVKHLKGGIHKYLDQFGEAGYFQGKNFVFDRRVSVDAIEHENSKDKYGNDCTENKCEDLNVVGKCLYCCKHHDKYTPDGVCTVCRELTLVCPDCRLKLNGEYHCSDHQHLKTCYFTNLTVFSEEELLSQLRELEELHEKIAVGRQLKQKRKTLMKQCEKIRNRLDMLKNQIKDCKTDICRSCGQTSCDNNCWGFHGLQRKKIKKDL